MANTNQDFDEFLENITLRTSARNNNEHSLNTTWLPYPRHEEDNFPKFERFIDKKHQEIYLQLINNGKKIVTALANKWYHYQCHIDKTEAMETINYNEVLKISTFLHQTRNKQKVIEHTIDEIAKSLNLPNLFNNQQTNNSSNGRAPTYQVYFPTFNQDSQSITDLQEFLDQFKNAIIES